MSNYKTMSPRELGFIGLGVMGYPMALNLLKKLEDGARLHVYDVDDHALRKFEEEAPTKVHVCSNAAEVAESSVNITLQCEGGNPVINAATRRFCLPLSQKEGTYEACISTSRQVC